MPGGKIWAVDVQPEMISLLQASAKKSGLTQIEPRQMEAEGLDHEHQVLHSPVGQPLPPISQ